jgi:hypothetical protein
MRMRIVGFLSLVCLGIAVGACAGTRAVAQTTAPADTPSEMEGPRKSLSEIDFSRIGRIAPKGRVQDKEYNQLEVIDQLIANGKDSIPFLISKLEDETVLDHHVIDYWSKVTVGDVALLILSNFSLDSTWTKVTIPGTRWEELFEAKKNPNIAFLDYYDTQIRKRGRGWVKAKWQRIWTTYKDRIVWDGQERCFKVV